MREAYFKKFQRPLQTPEAASVLQHYKIFGDTDILDLSWDPDVAYEYSRSLV